MRHLSVPVDAAEYGSRGILRKGFFDLGGELHCKSIEPLGEVANVLQEVIVKDDRRNGGKKSAGSGDQGFGNTRSDGAEAGGAGAAEAGEGVNNAPNGTEEADEGSYGAGGGEPGHTFFHAANFVGGGELHADSDGLQAFDSWRMRISRSPANLALKFAIAGGIDRRKRGAGGSQGLRVGDAAGGSEDAEKLIAFAADAAEEAELLQNQGPGNDGKQKQQKQDGSSDKAGLRKDVNNVGCEKQDEQKNDEPLSVRECCMTAKRSTFFWAQKT